MSNLLFVDPDTAIEPRIRNGRWKMLRILAVLILTASYGVVGAQDQGDETGSVDRTGANPSTPVRRPGTRDRSETQKVAPFSDPRRWLFIAVIGFLAIGGGRKWLHGRKGRALADKLAGGTATVEEIRNANLYGRIVVHDLFRELTDGTTPDRRQAALVALVRLWKADELIPEEEKAIVTRAFHVNWLIRRKYPRGLTGNLGIRADYGLPGTGDADLDRWLVEHLEWSHRVTGTRRASDDQWRSLPSGQGGAFFEIVPQDFPEDGPHRLILHPRVAVRGLTDNWQLDLPAQTTSFEWDDHLQAGALAGMPDDARAEKWREMFGFFEVFDRVTDSVHSKIDEKFRLFFPPAPELSILRPDMTLSSLPCDLAHQVYLEFEAVDGRWYLGDWVLPANPELIQGKSVFEMPAELSQSMNVPRLERAGRYRGRYVLESCPELGWSDPSIRSVWPERIESPWADFEVVRI